MEAGLPEAEVEAMKEALEDADFQTQLRRAVRAVFRRNATLAGAKEKMSR